ncbi:MAG: hypothetical protein A2X86_03490 [Bdellovibrionales bacterium GWA2_49_15]|nr:MAG: hypothetical protein A2X86_03490 [Bdellovibrionales bacterium GWA2_49_15]HAZ12279.1 hypothetical protein [Bdellovibrionales bacterium]
MGQLGIRLSERMAGWVQFSTPGIAGTQIEADAQYPFDFTIHAFTTKFFQYPFCLGFQGHANFPGLPLKEEATFLDRQVPIYGTMCISHRGVAYQIFSPKSPWGEWKIEGAKSYLWWPFSWKRLRHSLVWLPAEMQQDGKVIGKCELEYQPPLWQFPFGLRIKDSTWAHRPHGFLSARFYELGRHLYPDIKQLGTEEELIRSIEAQLAPTPYFIYLLLCWAMYFIRMLSWVFFFNSLSRLSPTEGEELLQKIRKNSVIKLALLPLLTTILYPLFDQKAYLKAKGQNIVEPPKAIEHEPWMAQSFPPRTRRTSDESVIEADCVVIGSGAGGAAFAAEMARKGKAVVVLEEGHYFKRQDLTGLAADMMRKLYTQAGIQFSLSNAPLWIPTGTCVGGTTFINSGTCIRTPSEVLDRWRGILGLDLDLEKYFPAVEQMLGSTPPVPEKIQGGVARVLARGLQGTGYTYGPLHRAENGCDGQGSCISGCPINAKLSTAVSYMPEALKRNAFLFSHMRAKKILVENGQAVGVSAGVPGFGPEFDMTVKAKMVVLAAGTFGTPQVLYRSGLHRSNPHIGRHLTIHPAFTIGGLFSEVVRETLFVPQSLGVFGIEGGDYVLEGYTLPVDVIPAAMGQWGRELATLMSEVQHFTNFSSMMRDVSEGQLILTPWGALPYYYVTPELMRNAQQSLKMMAKIFFKAGAKKVYLPIQGREVITSMEPIANLENESIHPARIIISAHHPLGTCRMARTEFLGAVSNEGELFAVKNLVVADGSTIPGPLGVNPQVTIMANSLRLADLWSGRI